MVKETLQHLGRESDQLWHVVCRYGKSKEFCICTIGREDVLSSEQKGQWERQVACRDGKLEENCECTVGRGDVLSSD